MVVQDFSFCVTNQTGDCDCGVAVVRLGEDCGGRRVAVTSTCVRSPPADAAQRSSNPPHPPPGRRHEGLQSAVGGQSTRSGVNTENDAGLGLLRLIIDRRRVSTVARGDGDTGKEDQEEKELCERIKVCQDQGQ